MLLAPWALDPPLLCKLWCTAVSVAAFFKSRDFVAAYAVFPKLRVDISHILPQAPIAEAVTHGPSLSWHVAEARKILAGCCGVESSARSTKTPQGTAAAACSLIRDFADDHAMSVRTCSEKGSHMKPRSLRIHLSREELQRFLGPPTCGHARCRDDATDGVKGATEGTSSQICSWGSWALTRNLLLFRFSPMLHDSQSCWQGSADHLDDFASSCNWDTVSTSCLRKATRAM